MIHNGMVTPYEYAERKLSMLRDQFAVIQSSYENAIEKGDDNTVELLQVELVALNGQIKSLRDWTNEMRPKPPDDFIKNWFTSTD